MKYNPTIYKNNEDNSCRYALGTEGKNTLFVIGINPSTADDKKPDRTITKVMRFAEDKKFDSFIMLNIYTQRSKDIELLDFDLDINKHKTNLIEISRILGEHENVTILAAWSEKLYIRTYLKNCLKDVYELTKSLNVTWVKLGELTKKGHPRHPSRAPYCLPFSKFNIDEYINKTKK